jgi:hypothetical protein
MPRFARPLLLAALIAALLTPRAAAIGVSPSPAEPDAATRAEIEAALAAAVARHYESALLYVIYDTGLDRLRVSADGAWALLWITALDWDTGAPVGMEPGLGIGRQTNGAWTVYLPGDPQWGALFAAVPGEILPQAEREFWQSSAGACNTSGIGPFTGYYLPWQGGVSLVLTQSIYHTLGWGAGNDPDEYMIHAFDFSTAPSNYFNVWASKPGTVKFWRDTQPDNDPASPGNYIVIQDTTTSPTSYALYLHLAQGSIPAPLKNAGAPVGQGELIGIADDTGASTNHHLHFQVHTNASSYWGCSVDVLFSDVAINGGRPRLPIEAQNYPQYGSAGQTAYVSGNSQTPPPDPNAPVGGIFAPARGESIAAPTVFLDGWAVDLDGSVAQAQFAVNYGTGWQNVGPVFNAQNLFNTTWDMCASAVPDGPVTVGVWAKDNSGNTVTAAGGVPFVKDYDCEPAPPACTPAADEIAIFELPDYQGDCTVIPVGTHLLTAGPAGAAAYPAGGAPPAAQAGTPVASVLVGADVYGSLFKDVLMLGRAQTFAADDANLSDNWSDPGDYQVAYVELRSLPPRLPLPAFPNGQAFSEGTQLTLVWDDGGGSEAFQARLTGPSGTVTSTWVSASWWEAGSLVAGGYTWEVRARNGGGVTLWSPSAVFTVNAAASIQSTQVITAPITEDFEGGANGWTATGYWNLLNGSGTAYSGSNAWWYGFPAGNYAAATYSDGAANTGSLTSPPIYIPAAGFYLRYWSNYQTESSAVQWDRRRVLISADGGAFEEVYPLGGELMDFWLKSPYLDLGAYAGQVIQIRFVFETLDSRKNGYDGWRMDLVTIDTTPPQSCAGLNEPDNSPAQATPISYGAAVSGENCPSGDLDYFVFSGTAGDVVGIRADAAAIGSALDPYIYLLDADGVSILAENDDEVPGVHVDSVIHYILPRSGTYYVKLRAWNYPGVGGNTLFYTLRLYNDSADPVITGINSSDPLTSIGALPPQVTLTALTSDAGSGVSFVEFFYHSNDFQFDNWVRFAVDVSSAGGWTGAWDTSLYPAQPGMVLLVRVHDKAGNVETLGLWALFELTERIFLPVVTRE